MRVFRFPGQNGPRLGVDAEGELYDLSATGRGFTDVSEWLSLPDPVTAVQDTLPSARKFPVAKNVTVLPPIDTQEVWACGVTYLRSKAARMTESGSAASFYDRVYEAERPEVFFKATPARVVGPDAPIRIRRDSTWNVPEPELALVLSSSGNLVGCTIGNDVSSRSIEGENPLYLPQAKIYDGCCALGPSILLNEKQERARKIRMTIVRNGDAVFSGETSTAAMRRTFAELAEYLFRELSFATGVFLLTGTGIVPADEFTLETGDVVEIAIEGIGTLKNPVTS